jgi:hypothetical protein
MVWTMFQTAAAAGDSDRSSRRTMTMLRSSRGVSGFETSGDASGNGNENDGRTEAPIPASTMPNTLAECPSSCTTCGTAP